MRNGRTVGMRRNYSAGMTPTLLATLIKSRMRAKVGTSTFASPVTVVEVGG